jgi:hypothetical protein
MYKDEISQTYGKNQRGRPKVKRLWGILTGMKEGNWFHSYEYENSEHTVMENSQEEQEVKVNSE